MTQLIGLCGYAGVGKDTAAANMPGWKRVAFADPLKDDLRPLVKMVGCDLSNPSHKAKARQLMVAWGATARAFQADFWIDRTMDGVRDYLKDGCRVVITDVRYPNEVKAILDLGGKVVRVFRNGFGPVSEEEARSVIEIDHQFCLPAVANDSTPAELGRRVLLLAGVEGGIAREQM
jgi:hypothetical protein